jgi:hypothetical protein
VGLTCQMPRAVPGPPGSAPLPGGCHAPHRSRALRPLSGPRAGCRDSLAPPARTPRRSSLASPVTPPSRPPRYEVTDARSVVVPPRRSPVAVVPRRHPRAGEPPRSSAISRAPVGAAVGPPCRPAEMGRARCADRGQAGPSPHGRGPRTRAAPAP